MDLLTNTLHILGSGAAAYVLAYNIRYPLTRPNILASFYLSESSSVHFLEVLKERAMIEKEQWLTEQLANHIIDEKKHSQFFSQALKQHNKRVVDFKNLSDEERRNPFFEAYFEGYSFESLAPDRIDWITFAGSTYILELDASKDFSRMASVLPENEPKDSPLTFLKKGLFSIAQDETRHAAYLYESLQRRLPQIQVDAIIEQWRIRKVKAMWAMGFNLIKSENGNKGFSLVNEGVLNDKEFEVLTKR
jgi:rubrerythrin